jgi:hypothetical protein
MVTLMVMVKGPVGEWTGLGRHTFSTAPQTGDYVTFNDDKGIGQAYRVKAVIHPSTSTETAGDLIVEHVGTEKEFRSTL